jgi:hypothetical protein
VEMCAQADDAAVDTTHESFLVAFDL